MPDTDLVLHWSSRSPFVRKVMACAHLCGLAERLTLVREQVGSATVPRALLPLSPLGRIPALAAPSGETWFGSGVICRVLAEMAGRTDIDPSPGNPDRLPDLRLEELADGIMQFTTTAVGERTRDVPSQPRLDAWETKIVSALNWLEPRAAALPRTPRIAHLALGAALGHVDFRSPHLDWRDTRPDLAAWWDDIAARPCFALTSHKEIY